VASSDFCQRCLFLNSTKKTERYSLMNYTSILPVNGILQPGDSVSSIYGNGEYKLTYQQTNGDLVLWQGDQILWHAGVSSPHPGQCIMQSNGQLVLYDTSQQSYWVAVFRPPIYRSNSILIVENQWYAGHAWIGQPAWTAQNTGQQENTGVLFNNHLPVAANLAQR
jgi:hypothetical protein